MIPLDEVLRLVAGLRAAELEAWIAEGWVRPERQAGAPVFAAVDVARVRLIVELREELEVGEGAMPVVLSLLDQLYAERARLRRLRDAVERAGLAGRLRDAMKP